MEPHEVMNRLHNVLTQGDETPGRPTLRVRLAVQLGISVVDVDRRIPLGDTTPETLTHVQMLVLKPGIELATRLVEAHFEGQRYVLEADLLEDTP